jgi:hypothetical protein
MANAIDLGDIEPQIEIIEQVNIRTVHKMLERAERKAQTAGRHQVAATKHAAAGTSHLAKVLESAMAFHGRSAKNRPSIRLKAPDTGGRPYHFGFTTITKGTRQKTKGANGPTSQPGGQAGAGNKKHAASKPIRHGQHRASTQEGAHQLYTEREAAVEKGGLPLEEHSQESGDPGPTAGPTPGGNGERKPEPQGPEHSEDRDTAAERSSPLQRAQEWVQEEVASVPGLSERSSEVAAQIYIEDPAKMPRLTGRTTSFGTIGATTEERLEFWELVHEHESDKGGRTQSRLVLELPHEASAGERHEIVRRFTDEMFRKKGLPYWASIHEPTKGNDRRNHHAHVVFTDRPMQKMINPATGEEAWDFTIAETHKKKNWTKVTRHPYRQNRDPGMRDRSWIKRARARFSEITNEEMERGGKNVRYDPRSYKDMGLDVAPMKHVNRILADKTKSRQFVVMDAEWTRKMIDEEIRNAAIRRDATFRDLVLTEQRLAGTARGAAHIAKTNDRLPPHLRMGPGRLVGTQLGSMVIARLLRIERERLATKFVDEATERTLKHIVEATTMAPRNQARGRIHDPTNAPDPEDLRILNEAAREELAEHQRQTRLSGISFGALFDDLRKIWNGGHGLSPSSPVASAETHASASRFSQRGTSNAPAQPPTPRLPRQQPATESNERGSTTSVRITPDQYRAPTPSPARQFPSMDNASLLSRRGNLSGPPQPPPPDPPRRQPPPEPNDRGSATTVRTTATENQAPMPSPARPSPSTNLDADSPSKPNVAATTPDPPESSNTRPPQVPTPEIAGRPPEQNRAMRPASQDFLKGFGILVPTWRWDDPEISKLSMSMRDALPGPEVPPEKIREVAEARLKELAAITRATQALMNRVESEAAAIAPKQAIKQPEAQTVPVPRRTTAQPIPPTIPTTSPEPMPDPPRRIEAVITRRLSRGEQAPPRIAEPVANRPIMPGPPIAPTRRPQQSPNSTPPARAGSSAPADPQPKTIQRSPFEGARPRQSESKTPASADRHEPEKPPPNKDANIRADEDEAAAALEARKRRRRAILAARRRDGPGL